ncbi:hypothetical protein JVU11DRAFT_11472 [Chiua virens]|nr:hypothetical protein JVU11DRAFT_11472 [Chiua virens]
MPPLPHQQTTLIDTIEQENDPPLRVDAEELPTGNRRHRTYKCRGPLELRYDNYNQPYIHALTTEIQEFDTPYLHALLLDNSNWYLRVENHAKSLGIGPLAPCTFAASPNEQKANCPHWHRDENNTLQRGALIQSAVKCPTTSHNHPPPLLIKTPPQIASCLESLLLCLEWKLADATPWRLVLDSGFIYSLHHALAWTSHERDPSPHDLHPSLGNLDHLRWFINVLQTSKFPQGTGFYGAKQLVGEHEQLPVDHRYLRCVEQYQLPNEDEFWLVICMTSRMSLLLVQAKRISIDTSFKRVCGWQEFEVEGWDNSHQRSMVLARAFTMSQSSDAHVILFHCISNIAEQDTGIPIKFFHIHGTGIESIIADNHCGQALGIFFLY